MDNSINKKILSVYFKTQIRNGVKDLRAYSDKIESYLESQKYKIEERHEKEVYKTDEEKESGALFRNISLQLGYGRHVEIFTKSAIVSIYTYLEYFLDDFCKKINEYDKRLISPKDIYGSGIFRSKIYLSKVLLLNLEELNKEWEALVKLSEIRNFLVHSNGVATNKDSKLKIQKTIKDLPGVKLDRDHIKISKAYIDDVLSTIEIVLENIESRYSAQNL
nr:hypothetical protein [uncultured Pseudomonas sp.]